jgi:NAD-dependent deacetylase
MNKKKITIFTGAGISAESGINTFRDSNGLWENHKIEEVCTLDGWRKDRERVLNFYNDRRKQMPNVEPNGAHKALVKLEEHFEVTIVTQNVDDLHERAGSTNIIHLHGELTKARGSIGNGNPLNGISPVYDIGYNEINIGDKCATTNSQLRPHIVWFGEYPFGVYKAIKAFEEADIVLVIGTSLQISYTLSFFDILKKDAKIIYIDPSPVDYLTNMGLTVEYVRKGAVEGVTEIVERIINENQQK